MTVELPEVVRFPTASDVPFKFAVVNFVTPSVIAAAFNVPLISVGPVVVCCTAAYAGVGVEVPKVIVPANVTLLVVKKVVPNELEIVPPFVKFISPDVSASVKVEIVGVPLNAVSFPF